MEGLGVVATQAALSQADTALARFETLSGQLVTLSRQNSNVRSLALALGPKAALRAKCEANLNSLAQALAKEGPLATSAPPALAGGAGPSRGPTPK